MKIVGQRFDQYFEVLPDQWIFFGRRTTLERLDRVFGRGLSALVEARFKVDDLIVEAIETGASYVLRGEAGERFQDVEGVLVAALYPG